MTGWTARADDYSDRVRPPAATVSALRPHFAALGVTRLARQTGLDRLGIPCFAAIRPNSATLAANQGKGMTDDAAMASAVMEAAEYAVAERPTRVVRLASIDTLRREGAAVLLPTGRLPAGSDWPVDAEMAWLEGHDYFSGDPILVPRDLVALTHSAGMEGFVAQSTNGLASGNIEAEAGFHALCELIERDAMTLWNFRSPDEVRARAIAPAAFHDPMVTELAQGIAAHGLSLRLFDLTTDIGVPVIMALIEEQGARLYFDLAMGVGCHPVAARAALRGITEAAQTRVTNVAGARDDFDPAEYTQRLDPGAAALIRVTPGDRPQPAGASLGTPLADLHEWVGKQLQAAGVSEVTMVPLGGEAFGIAVVKVIAPALEDSHGNPSWRPGPRAMRLMTRFA